MKTKKNILNSIYINIKKDAYLSLIVTINILLITMSIAVLSIVIFFTDPPSCKSLSNNCLKEIMSNYSIGFLAVKNTFNLSVTITTLYIAFFAIISYRDNKSKNEKSNHLEHISLFRSYIEGEFRHYTSISKDSFHIYKMHSCIFNSPETGDFSMSEEFRTTLKKIVTTIKKSNAHYTSKSFNIYHHRNSIINSLANIGIEIEPTKRLDYLLIEDDLFELLDNLQTAFFKSQKISLKAHPYYR